jgi:protein associated with RNAse G/E
MSDIAISNQKCASILYRIWRKSTAWAQDPKLKILESKPQHIVHSEQQSVLTMVTVG